MANANKMVQELAFLPEIQSGPKSVRSIKKFIEEIAGQVSNVMDNIGKAAFSDKDLSRIAGKMKKLASDISAVRAEGNKSQEEALLSQFRLEKKNLEDVIKRRVQAKGILDKGTAVGLEGPGKTGEGFAKGIAGAFTDVLSGELGNIGDLFKRMGGQMKKAGFAAQAKETDESTKGIMSGMAGILRSLGPAVIAIGAIAAGFAAIVKIMLDADTLAKDWNRTLMEGGAVIGDITADAYKLEDVLEEVRNAAKDFSKNTDWGTLAADQLKILGAWSEAGYTLREMSAGLEKAEDRMNAYRQATAAALTYSKLLGESAEGVAKGMAEYMEDLGLTLEGVEKRYGAIYEAAKMSGFGTKRFFGMILQATSGMSMYNVRLEEAAGLMLNLSKILGSKVGPEFFKSLTTGFADASLQDRIKQVMISDPAKVRETIKKDSAKAGADLADKIQSAFSGQVEKGAQALQAIGIDNGISEKLLQDMARGGQGARTAREELGKRLVAQLQKMTPEERAGAVEKMPRDLAAQFQSVQQLVKGIKGDVGDMAVALPALSPGANLAMKIDASFKHFSKPIHELEATERMGYEAMVGIAGQQFDELSRVSQFAYDGFASMEAEIAKGGKVSDERNKEFIKAYGSMIENGKKITAKLDEDGNIIRIGDEIKDQKDLLMAQGSALREAMEKPLSEQEAIAKMVADNTTDISTYIKMGVETFLEGIYSTLNALFGWITGSTENRKARMEALEVNRRQQRDIMKERADIMRKLAEQQQIAASTTGANKRAALDQIEKLEGLMSKQDAALKINREMVGAIKKGEGKDVGTLLKNVSEQMFMQSEKTGKVGTRYIEGVGKKAMAVKENILETTVSTDKLKQIYSEAFGDAGKKQIKAWEDQGTDAIHLFDFFAKKDEVTGKNLLTTMTGIELPLKKSALATEQESQRAQKEAQEFKKNMANKYPDVFGDAIADGIDKSIEKKRALAILREAGVDAALKQKGGTEKGVAETLDTMAATMVKTGGIGGMLQTALAEKKGLAERLAQGGAANLGAWFDDITAFAPGSRVSPEVTSVPTAPGKGTGQHGDVHINNTFLDGPGSVRTQDAYYNALDMY